MDTGRTIRLQNRLRAAPLCCSICLEIGIVHATAFDILYLQPQDTPRGYVFNFPRGRWPFSPYSETQTAALSYINLMTPSTPRGTRVSHIGIAVEALAGSLPFFRDVLGLPEVPLDDADGAKIVGFSAGESLVELLEADDPESPIARFVARRGPGIHHICFAVDDLDAVLAAVPGGGRLKLIDEQPRVGVKENGIAFLHPRSTGGVLVELSDH